MTYTRSTGWACPYSLAPFWSRSGLRSTHWSRSGLRSTYWSHQAQYSLCWSMSGCRSRLIFDQDYSYAWSDSVGIWEW